MTITGDVTGVGFRAWARRHAHQLGIAGWIRNVADGEVEAVAQGDRPVLERFVSLCQKGPDVAWVQQVDVSWQTVKEEHVEFEIHE